MAEDSGVADAYEIADSFAQASSRVLDYRVSHRAELTPSEAQELEQCEDRLDHMVVMFRGYGIRLIGAGAADAVAELKLAVAGARETLEQVARTKKAIKVAASLVDLAAALLSRDPKAVLAAAKGLRKQL